MKLITTSYHEVKKSKFYGYLYQISSTDNVKIILDKLKSEHKNLRHAPYAYIFNNTASKTDDKEPTNTAGIQIFNVLKRNKLDNHLLVIVRYFGGKKLGAPLLLRSYSKAANLCIKN